LRPSASNSSVRALGAFTQQDSPRPWIVSSVGTVCSKSTQTHRTGVWLSAAKLWLHRSPPTWAQNMNPVTPLKSQREELARVLQVLTPVLDIVDTPVEAPAARVVLGARLGGFSRESERRRARGE
jgi:hypothetical protein